jgi:hypothetical protein
MSSALQVLYGALPHQAIRISATKWAICGPDLAEPRIIDDVSFRSLQQCRGARTIREHMIHTMVNVPELDGRKAAEDVLAALTRNGLLYAGQWQPQSGNRHSAAPAVPKIGIITADRPAMLWRCLSALTDICRRFSISTEILIVDGSKSSDNRQRNAAIANQIPHDTALALHYIGERERAAICARLQQCGAVTDLLQFALTGHAGANRNLLSLLTMGENLITVDDDVVCTPWRQHAPSGILRLADHDCGHQVQYFESRRDAVSVPLDDSINPIEELNRFLGAELGAVAAEYPGRIELSNSCSHLLWSLDQQEHNIIELSFAGLAGDSGASSSSNILFGAYSGVEVLTNDAVCDRALSKREVRRIVPSETVSHSPWCMTYFTGLCNRRLLPPFMPVGRNQDGVFGNLLAWMDPNALSAHLPFGIIHDSSRPSDYEGGLAAALYPRLWEFVLSPLLRVMQGERYASRSAALARMGRTLTDIAALDSGSFAAYATRAVIDRRHSVLESLRAGAAGKCARWRSALSELEQAMEKNVADPAFFVPLDLPSRTGLDRQGDLRTFIGEFGRLLSAWPALTEAARETRQTMSAKGAIA